MPKYEKTFDQTTTLRTVTCYLLLFTFWLRFTFSAKLIKYGHEGEAIIGMRRA